jgi:hypothetical protein
MPDILSAAIGGGLASSVKVDILRLTSKLEKSIVVHL